MAQERCLKQDAGRPHRLRVPHAGEAWILERRKGWKGIVQRQPGIVLCHQAVRQNPVPAVENEDIASEIPDARFQPFRKTPDADGGRQHAKKLPIPPDWPQQREDRALVIRPPGRRYPLGSTALPGAFEGAAHDRVVCERCPIETCGIAKAVDDGCLAVGKNEDEATDRRVGSHGADHERLQPCPVIDIDPTGFQDSGNESRLDPGRREVVFDLTGDERDPQFRLLAQQIDGAASRVVDGDAQNEQERDGDQRTEAQGKHRRHRKPPTHRPGDGRSACQRNAGLRFGHEKQCPHSTREEIVIFSPADPQVRRLPMAALTCDPRAANSKEVYPLQHFLTAGAVGSDSEFGPRTLLRTGTGISVYLRCLARRTENKQGVLWTQTSPGFPLREGSETYQLVGGQGKDAEHEMARPQRLLFALGRDDRACVSVSRP